MDAQSAYFIVSIVITVFGAVYAFARWAWPRIKAVTEKLRPYFAGLASLDVICADLAAIKHELLPNGGGSFRDEFREQARENRMQGAILRASLDFSDAAMFQADATGEFRWVSATLQGWVGRSFSHLLRRGWLTSVADEDRERVRAGWEAALRDQREYRGQYTLISDTGERIPVECVARPVCDPATGVLHRYLGHIRRRSSAITSAWLPDDGA
jgi:PAS domain S-box-containing protein